MGNGEWGMGNWDKTKIPFVLPLLKNLPFLSTLYSLLSTPHSLLPTPQLQRTIKRQGAVPVDFLATDFEGGKQRGCKVVGTVLYC